MCVDVRAKIQACVRQTFWLDSYFSPRKQPLSDAQKSQAGDETEKSVCWFAYVCTVYVCT